MVGDGQGVEGRAGKDDQVYDRSGYRGSIDLDVDCWDCEGPILSVPIAGEPVPTTDATLGHPSAQPSSC